MGSINDGREAEARELEAWVAGRKGIVVPNFFCIGAYKAGTTTIESLLDWHPEVFVPDRKEPNFFAFRDSAYSGPAKRGSVLSAKEYVRLFARARAERVVGEVSPEYMIAPGAAQELARWFPDARIVAILRDPVARALSDFWMYKRDGVEKAETFEDALAMQSDRRDQGLAHGYYLETGFYGRQLEPYYKSFAAENIYIMKFEALISNIEEQSRALFRFLGVNDELRIPSVGRANRSGVASGPVGWIFRNRGVLRKSLSWAVPRPVRKRVWRTLEGRLRRPKTVIANEAELRALFVDDVRLLENLTGQDFSDWGCCGGPQ